MSESLNVTEFVIRKFQVLKSGNAALGNWPPVSMFNMPSQHLAHGCFSLLNLVKSLLE